MEEKETYDVAISFLSKDEDLALKLYERLSPTLDVFVYSKKQEDVAGTDGTMSFREVFRKRSRLNVVLYRKGWGETRWTAVEEEAIKDCALENRWEGLLFVMLDKTEPPNWLPETNIRLDYGSYGFEETVGAIKARAQDRGSTIRRQTPADMAAIVARSKDFEAKRERKLRSEEGVGAAKREVHELFKGVLEHVDEIRQETPELQISGGKDCDRCIITSRAAKCYTVALFWHQMYANSLSDSSLDVVAFRGTMPLPEETERFLDKPVELNRYEFGIDFTREYGWCWKDARGRHHSCSELAEYAVARLLELLR